jgi:hypothetical protein
MAGVSTKENAEHLTKLDDLTADAAQDVVKAKGPARKKALKKFGFYVKLRKGQAKMPATAIEALETGVAEANETN